MSPLRTVVKGLNSKVFVVLGIFSGAVILLVVGFLIISDLLEDRNVNRAEEIKMAYNLEQLDQTIAGQAQNHLLYFEDLDQLFLDMELYRQTKLPWTHQDVGEFWIPADRSDIDYFTEANHELIWEILKDAP